MNDIITTIILVLAINSLGVSIATVTPSNNDAGGFVEFNGHSGVLYIEGALPIPGLISDFQQTDCWYTWCGGATITQYGSTYQGVWQ